MYAGNNRSGCARKKRRLTTHDEEKKKQKRIVSKKKKIEQTLSVMGKKLLLLHEVSPFMKSMNILVKIIRIWIVYKNYNLPARGQISMILMDETGNLIRAERKNALISKFEDEFSEGSVVFVRNFEVVENNDNNYIVNHRYKVLITRNIHMKIINTFRGPLNCFRLAKFEDIINEKNDLKITVDLIGRIVSCGWEMMVWGGKETMALYMQLEDTDGEEIEGILFGCYGNDFAEYVNSHTDDECRLTVIILQFVEVLLIEGTPYFKNCSTATKMLINPEVPEVETFNRLEEFVAGDESEPSSEDMELCNA